MKQTNQTLEEIRITQNIDFQCIGGNMGMNNLEVKKKFYEDAVVLLENGIREIRVPDELVYDMITIFNRQANIAESTLAYANYLASKPDEDDPRL